LMLEGRGRPLFPLDGRPYMIVEPLPSLRHPTFGAQKPSREQNRPKAGTFCCLLGRNLALGSQWLWVIWKNWTRHPAVDYARQIFVLKLWVFLALS
jgi:hypothetical protein